MNLKKKIFGLGAVAALSLSMMSGAMASDIGTNVDLKKNPTGLCTAAITNTNPKTFGSYTFDGTQWKWDTTMMSLATNTTQNILPNNVYAEAKCTLNVSASDLVNGKWNIPVGNMMFSSGSKDGPWTQMGSTEKVLKSNLTKPANDAWFRFDGLDNLTLGPGTYDGTITITASKGS